MARSVLNNVPIWVLVLMAVGLTIGAVVVAVNPAHSEREAHYVLEQSRASALFVAEQARGRNLLAVAHGLRDQLPALRSVSVGFWVGVGSRDEHDHEFGASHFLEHLMFKGTADRSAAQIAHAVESVGGDMNAFTAQEMTAFYVRVPDEELDLALDILADVVWSPALRANDVDAERNVILEELHMRDDAPDDIVHELFAGAMFPDHPLGREVLGTQQSIEDMSRDSIASFHGRHYRPSSIVVAA